jgi:hypothetical protein
MLRWIFCAALVVATAATASAQPAKPDLAEAAALYRAAEQAMAERRYDDASRDYGAAYEISKDAVLFFKIGSALDKGGKCPVAVTYYRRYLREGKPSAEHQKMTNERIAACEGGKKAEPTADDKPKAETKPDGEKPKTDDKAKPGAKPETKPDAGKPTAGEKKEAASTGAAPIPDGTAGTAAAGSSAAGSASAVVAPEPAAAAPGPAPALTSAPAAAPAATAEPTGAVAAAAAEREAAEAAEAVAAAEAAQRATAEAAATAPDASGDDAAAFPPPPLRRTAAWLSIGTGIAFVTIGAVMALSAESTEDDIADLYIVRLGDEPLTYSGSTKRRYDELVDRGDTYQTLAWASFGVAAAAAAAATYFFLTSPAASSEEREPAKPIALRPLVSRDGGGVGASWMF